MKKSNKKNRKNKSVLLRLFILAVCCYFTFTLADLWNELNRSRKELSELQAEQAKITQDNEELKALLNSDSNKEIIEKAARERLGFIYSDEQVFVDISGD